MLEYTTEYIKARIYHWIYKSHGIIIWCNHSSLESSQYFSAFINEIDQVFKIETNVFLLI